MAIMTVFSQFTGSIGPVTGYKMKGFDQMILRTKGGPTKQQIKNGKNFAATRNLNNEWKGVCMAAGLFRRSFYVVKHLADFNFTGITHKLCKTIQLMDTAHIPGSRSILFSEHPYIFENFHLNQKYTFDTIVTHPIQASVNRADASATITIPAIIPGISFKPQGKQPVYRFIFSLSVLPDCFFDPSEKKYVPVMEFCGMLKGYNTEWRPVTAGIAPETITITPDYAFEPIDGISLVLSAGIEFGYPLPDNTIQHAKYAGAAKVLLVG
jgi:hypothetical protein